MASPHLTDAPPETWIWLQHTELRVPLETVPLRDGLLAIAYARGHRVTDGPGPGTYALAVGADVTRDDEHEWFLARPVTDPDGVVRYWVESRSGPDVMRGARTYDAGEVRDAFAEFIAWL